MPLLRRGDDPEKEAQKEAERLDKEQEKESKRIDREREKSEADERRKTEAFAQTPQGRARAAWHAGDKLFQIVLPVAETQRTIMGYITGSKYETRRREHDHATILDAIEAEGWLLEHVGYVFEHRETVSQDKFMSTGQTAKVTGQLTGVYIFRAVDVRDNELAASAESSTTLVDE